MDNDYIDILADIDEVNPELSKFYFKRVFEKLFDMEKVKLEFTDDALGYIVDKATEFKLGARGLRSICEA